MYQALTGQKIDRAWINTYLVPTDRKSCWKEKDCFAIAICNIKIAPIWGSKGRQSIPSCNRPIISSHSKDKPIPQEKRKWLDTLTKNHFDWTTVVSASEVKYPGWTEEPFAHKMTTNNGTWFGKSLSDLRSTVQSLDDMRNRILECNKH